MSGSNFKQSQEITQYLLNHSHTHPTGNHKEIEYHDDFLNSLININLKEELSTSNTTQTSFNEDLMDKDGQVKLHENEEKKCLRLSEIIVDNYKREYRELRTNVYYKILSQISAVKRKLSFNAKPSDKLHMIEKNKTLQNVKKSRVLTNLEMTNSMQSKLSIYFRVF
jgi:hypothetical protein